MGVVFCYLLTVNWQPAHAACANPAGNEGDQIYNADYNLMQFCDGTLWRSMDCSGTGINGCTAPSDCSNVGDVCADGSIFAGFMLYGTSCEPLFVTDDNQSAGSKWDVNGGALTNADDLVDGQANQAWIVANETLIDFPAFNDCETLSRHSQTDWYLPARDEFFVLWKNKAAIDASSLNPFGTTDPYWSSTEYENSNTAWRFLMSSATQDDLSKTNPTMDVRCVRRD